MRILIVTEDLPAPIVGGAGKHAVLLANSLIDAGHHVEMLGCAGATADAEDTGFKGLFHPKIDLSGTGWKEHVIGAFLPMRRSHQARRIWAAIRSLEGPWDVVHYHGHATTLGAIVPSDVNFVHTLHDQGAECMIKVRFRKGAPCGETDPRACAACATERPNRLQIALSAYSVRHHRALAVKAFTRHKAIFVSGFIAQRFVSVVGAPSELRTHVVHNFIDAPQIRRRLKSGRQADVILPQRKPVVFMAGRIDASKGFQTLLESIGPMKCATLAIRVAGDGPDLAGLRSQFSPHGVAFLGWQSLQSVLDETANADVCVVPSIWEEPCGTTILEALTLGKTVYALSRGGTPELARYCQFKDQLRLFPDMKSLVGALMAASISPSYVENTTCESADVLQRLPEILAVYADRIGQVSRQHEGVA